MSKQLESEDEYTETGTDETGEESEYTDEEEDDDLGDRYSSMTRQNGDQDDFDFEESDNESHHSKPVVSQPEQYHPLRQSSASNKTLMNSSSVSRVNSATYVNQLNNRTGSAKSSSNPNIQQRVPSAVRVSSAVSTRSTVVKNQPFDEVIETGDSESDTDSIPSEEGTPRMIQAQPSTNGTRVNSGKVLNPSMNDNSKTQQARSSAHGNLSNSMRRNLSMDTDSVSSDESGKDDDEDEDESTDDEDSPKPLEYNPKDYEQLPVSAEIKQLFAYISAYKPQEIELDTKLKPFIPDYIAAVGELDPFLKVPRPDGKPDFLGLKVIDEPAADQSDPTVVTLNISYRDTKISNPVTIINSVELAEKNPKRIQKWIEDIRELHKTKPPPTVNYSKNMPDINQLMQAWPEQFEELLQSVELPGADVDFDLEEYVKFVCTVLDIPVYGNPIESLHLLFTLYLEFKANQHFSQQIEQQM